MNLETLMSELTFKQILTILRDSGYDNDGDIMSHRYQGISKCKDGSCCYMYEIYYRDDEDKLSAGMVYVTMDEQRKFKAEF